MSFKIPLRFLAAWRRLQPGRLSHWVSLVLLVVGLFFGVSVFYLLSIRWFKGEFEHAVNELVRKEAMQTSRTLADTVYDILARHGSSSADDGRLTRALAGIIHHNPNIVGVIISDLSGRIVRMVVFPQAAQSPLLQTLNQSAHALDGYDVNDLLTLLIAEQPKISPFSTPIRRDNRIIGGLTFLVDQTITTSAVDLAVTRMTSRLTILLGVMALLVALAALLIRRQQVIARRLTEKRTEVERLAYVGTLAAGLAHEIRNPLNALAMQLELLEEDVGEGAPQLVAPRLQHIRKGLAGVERTVHDFLSYATPGRQQPRTIELASVVKALCEEAAQGVTDVPIRMECIVAPGLSAWCDPHALRQILSNLIINALRAQKKRLEGGQLRVEAARNGNWVEIYVDDAGPGVPDELRERIFDCFFTTQSEGTGLGLPIARRLSEMNGGSLTLDRAPSPLGGARFCLRLSARPLSLPFD